MRRHAMTREQALKALELHAGASFQEIKQAHRDLALVWHPDRCARHTPGYRKRRLRGSRRSTAHTMCCDRTMTALQGLADRGQSTPGPSRAHLKKSEPEHRGREAVVPSSANPQNPETRKQAWSSLEQVVGPRSRRHRARADPGRIAGHLIAVFLFFLFAFRDVQPAILFVVIFSLLPLIYFRWATAAESWREAVAHLWRSPMSWVAVLGALFCAVFVAVIVFSLLVGFVLDWLFTKAPLAAGCSYWLP